MQCTVQCTPYYAFNALTVHAHDFEGPRGLNVVLARLMGRAVTEQAETP